MEFFLLKHGGVGRDTANLTAEFGQMIWNDFVRQSLPTFKISYRQLSVQKLQKWTKCIKKICKNSHVGTQMGEEEILSQELMVVL